MLFQTHKSSCVALSPFVAALTAEPLSMPTLTPPPLLVAELPLKVLLLITVVQPLSTPPPLSVAMLSLKALLVMNR